MSTSVLNEKHTRTRHPRIVIVGAGIAGMAAGVYARLNGYDVTIVEKNDGPGGLCTSWNRGDFTFDYCLHNLAGTAPDSALYSMWHELGALDGTELISNTPFTVVEDVTGDQLFWYGDRDRLKLELTQLSPQDGGLVEDLVRGATDFSKFDYFATRLSEYDSPIKTLQRAPTMIRYGRQSLADIAGRFSSSFLRRAVPHIQYDLAADTVPLTTVLAFLAGIERDDLRWPVGGSLAFSRRIARRFEVLDGELRTGTEVRQILVRDDVAYGVETTEGETIAADFVVSAADGFATIYRMLSGKFQSATVDSYYTEVDDEQAFGLHLFLGLTGPIVKRLENEPRSLVLLLPETAVLGGIHRDSLFITVHHGDSGLCKPGSAVMKIHLDGNYIVWKELRENSHENYFRAKEMLRDEVVGYLEKRFPGINDSVREWDVTTPVTVERFTGNVRGWQPWPVPGSTLKTLRRGLTRTLPGLGNFYMVGQWADAIAGVSNAAVAGRNLIQELCRQQGRRFRTE